MSRSGSNTVMIGRLILCSCTGCQDCGLVEEVCGRKTCPKRHMNTVNDIKIGRAKVGGVIRPLSFVGENYMPSNFVRPSRSTTFADVNQMIHRATTY